MIDDQASRREREDQDFAPSMARVPHQPLGREIKRNHENDGERLGEYAAVQEQVQYREGAPETDCCDQRGKAGKFQPPGKQIEDQASQYMGDEQEEFRGDKSIADKRLQRAADHIGQRPGETEQGTAQIMEIGPVREGTGADGLPEFAKAGDMAAGIAAQQDAGIQIGLPGPNHDEPQQQERRGRAQRHEHCRNRPIAKFAPGEPGEKAEANRHQAIVENRNDRKKPGNRDRFTGPLQCNRGVLQLFDRAQTNAEAKAEQQRQAGKNGSRPVQNFPPIG